MDATPDRVQPVARALAVAGCVAADDEAIDLVAHAPDEAWLASAVARRADGEPLAWILGAATFCGVRVRVDAGVFVPRPQTEALATRAAGLLPVAGRSADLCTGSGAVAAVLAARRPTATVVACDRDPRAASCARRNGVQVVVGDLDAPFASGAFDLVTAVPPYVPRDALHLLPRDVVRHEPRGALDGGPGDGTAIARRAIRGAARLLRTGGWLLLELGGSQDAAVADDLSTTGFDAVRTWRDEDGDLRGLEARRT